MLSQINKNPNLNAWEEFHPLGDMMVCQEWFSNLQKSWKHLLLLLFFVAKT